MKEEGDNLSSFGNNEFLQANICQLKATLFCNTRQKYNETKID